MLKDALMALPQTNEMGVSTYFDMVVSLQAMPKRLSPKNLISWANILA